MKATLILGAFFLVAGRSESIAADTVELNGITSLFGENMAFFLLYQPALTKPINFTLAEGESQFGFKLLAVDAIAHRVQIEQCGMKKYLRLGTAPDASAPANSEPATAAGQPASNQSAPADSQAVASYLASEAVERIKAGNPGWNGAVAGGEINSTGSKNSTAGINADESNYASEEWYQESLSIEQSRAMTVNDVLAGKLTPFPRTPLTPPGTPGQLVSQEVYFANYIPGFKVTGFLNQ